MTSTAPTLPAAVTRMRELAHSAACAAAIRAAVRLGLPDALGDTPATADELAAAVRADPGALRRLLRALTCYDVFAAEGDRFVHTETSRLLREDAPRGVKYNALWATEPWTWELWPRLDEAVRTGRSVFPDLHGAGFFEYLHAEAPESAAVFDRAMTQSSKLSNQAVADVLDVGGAEVLADIAGGQGQVLATVLERHAGLRGVLLDLPSVVAGADPRLTEGGALAGRARLVPGDCLESIPVEADLYLFKNILEWDDASTVLALRNAAAAARPGARVVVVENLVDDSPEPRFTTAMDLLLLLNVGGKKHTRDGLLGLVRAAGLRVVDVRPVNSYLHLVETVVPG
ncbi:methyltransferase [Amycolatopsis samaneae]|uniref:Methyltransferase n=1 Tax=Amycolatopsis samaneae TaxID=664691 RepID=A0ABW5GRL8_9PSEU